MSVMRASTQSDAALDSLHLSPKGFVRFARYITSELGIKMPESKASMLQSRLARRIRELGFNSVEQYGEYLFSSNHGDEREYFINAITTHKTDFFREPEHFAFLVQKALPALTSAGSSSRTVHLWSAACSSGEEPYTLAMTLGEYVRSHPAWDFAILATDVSTKVLARARQGIYTEEEAAPVPPEMCRRYLLKGRERAHRMVRVVPTLREKISFHRLNLIAKDYRVKDYFDVIFLRNVLIYFDKALQERVINRLCRHLKPGGYLFVGHSESLADFEVPVERVHISVYRLPM